MDKLSSNSTSTQSQVVFAIVHSPVRSPVRHVKLKTVWVRTTISLLIGGLQTFQHFFVFGQCFVHLFKHSSEHSSTTVLFCYHHVSVLPGNSFTSANVDSMWGKHAKKECIYSNQREMIRFTIVFRSSYFLLNRLSKVYTDALNQMENYSYQPVQASLF